VCKPSNTLCYSNTEARFEAIREYVTTPLLMQTVPWELYIRRREWLAQNTRSTGALSPELLESYPHAVTFSELRLDKLADSTITGAVLGGLTNAFRRTFMINYSMLAMFSSFRRRTYRHIIRSCYGNTFLLNPPVRLERA
jgi:hypothetical protein